MKILRKFEQWLSAQYRKQERALFDRGVRHAQLKLKQAQEQVELAPAKLALEVEGHYDEFAMGVRHALKDYEASLNPIPEIPITLGGAGDAGKFMLKQNEILLSYGKNKVERS